MVGGGQREWTSVQADRQFKIGREGVESGAKRAVQLSLWVADGGLVRIPRMTVNDKVNSQMVGRSLYMT